MAGALAGLRVVEMAGDIAGPYCAKLLADLGAEVTKIEPPTGDPLRSWGPFPDGRADPDRSGMFEYVNAGKRGATSDLTLRDGVESVRCLIAAAHVLIDALPPGTLDGYGLDGRALAELRPGLVAVRISDFGRDGPLRDRVASSLTMQAASGWINVRDPDRPPVQAGARISEYVAGGYAALGALTALRNVSAGGGLVEVDVSVLESLLSTLPYPMLMAERMRKLGLPTNTRAAPMMGIVRAADGWIGINCLTGQHWLDVCAMLGLPEYGEHQIAIMLGGPERGEFFARAQPWLDERTVAEILELSQAMRIPAAPVNDGATAPRCAQYAERRFFVYNGDDRTFLRPGAAFRLSRTPVLPPRPAPRLGAEVSDTVATRHEFESASDPAMPFAGVKVLDLSTFWAGAYLTCYLGAFGADIVKIESIQRPDGHRFSGAWSYEGDRWYERSGIWQGTNLNKRDVTLDLTSDRGRELVRRLAGEADVVVENFSPRVIEQFGLDYESLKTLRPDVIFVRMPGFGLQGPWRDYVGWALNIEQTSGMSAVTGYPDGPPCNIQGPADPVVGVHAGVALLAALEYRRRTGEGQLIEVAQIEVAACLAAEPVIEYSMNAVVHPREGNRRRGHLQGVYPTAADDWVAISVRDDADLNRLSEIMSRPELQWGMAHDHFDTVVADWTGTRTAEEIVKALSEQRLPVAQVLTAERMYELPQLDARNFYQELKHPVTGPHRYPGWPLRITPGPAQHHRSPPPTLGQHNDEILRCIGLTDDEIEDLRASRVIGETALHA
jgi:crotonobetainyl-CoA:carnitine CoA-transferase CaiB-like acyl-CoA transferase